MAKSVVDRLTHGVHVIDTGTESWRFRHGLTQRERRAGARRGSAARSGG
ncbi:MAG: ATP-binding protein [Actinomycetota bacterium]|nr:ATP-binding protein [Actinomycetota bacterium]